MLDPQYTYGVKLGCQICRNAAKKAEDLGALEPLPAPILGVIEPTDPDDDAPWDRVALKRPVRSSQRLADHLARERHGQWVTAGRPGAIDPGRLLPDRVRWVDMAVVDVPEKMVMGGTWSGVVDLRCQRCGHEPRIPVGALVDGARRQARTRRRIIYI